MREGGGKRSDDRTSSIGMELDGFFSEANFRCMKQRLKENSIHGEFNKGVTIGFLLPVSPYLSIELRSARQRFRLFHAACFFLASHFFFPFSLFLQPIQIYYDDNKNLNTFDSYSK